MSSETVDNCDNPGDSNASDDALRVALVGCVATTLLHAVANCTNVIAGRAGILEMTHPNDLELQRALREIRAQADGVSSLATRMREFVAVGATESHAANAARELEQVLAALAPVARARGVDIQVTTLDAELCAAVPGVSLHAILYGLLGFAIHTLPRSSVVRTEVSRASTTSLFLTVTMPSSCTLPKERRELMAPWLTGSVQNREARLLLALALGSAHARGGRFELENDGESQSVVVCLPARGEGLERS